MMGLAALLRKGREKHLKLCLSAYTLRKGHVRTQQEGFFLQARRRVPPETESANTLIMDCSPPELLRK